MLGRYRDISKDRGLRSMCRSRWTVLKYGIRDEGLRVYLDKWISNTQKGLFQVQGDRGLWKGIDWVVEVRSRFKSFLYSIT